MVQYKKDEIKEKIDSAAIAVFAVEGYESTKISEIAKKAGVSVGNVYRYYGGKEEIFYSILPEQFLMEYQLLLREKIAGFRGHIGSGRYQQTWLTSEPFISFMAEHRSRILILFKGSRGTRYEKIKTELVSFLIGLLRENYPEMYEKNVEAAGNEFVITSVYEGLIDLFGKVLSKAETEQELKEYLSLVNTYHLHGITEIIEGSEKGGQQE